jgi:hypothetical protein
MATYSRWVWRTRHRRYFLVDHRGTHRLDPQQGEMLFDAPRGLELYFADLRLPGWTTGR